MTRDDALDLIQSTQGSACDCCDPLGLNLAIDACCQASEGARRRIEREESPADTVASRFGAPRAPDEDLGAVRKSPSSTSRKDRVSIYSKSPS